MARSGATELIGWAATPHTPIYHEVDTTRAGNEPVSRCGVNLARTGERKDARDWERPCVACYRPRKPPPAKRPLPTTPAESTAPIRAEHLRVDPAGHLVIRVGRSRADRWIALNIKTGTIVGAVTPDQAKGYPTLRSLMPPADLIGVRDLAAEWGMSLTAVSQLMKRREDFPTPDVRLGDRSGWLPERLGELLSFNLNRGGRTGGGRPRKRPR